MNDRKTALLSAYDKTGLEDFARELVALGWTLLASSGTAKYLQDHKLPVEDVSNMIGKPILGHRVVTLSRKIYAALLATAAPEDQAELDHLGVPRIDLVYVNLYPLKEEIAKPEATLDSVVEMTDIGGPTLLRAAAKGRRYVLCEPKQFPVVLNFIRREESFDAPDMRPRFLSTLAALAEEQVSEYARMSSEYHRQYALHMPSNVIPDMMSRIQERLTK